MKGDYKALEEAKLRFAVVRISNSIVYDQMLNALHHCDSFAVLQSKILQRYHKILMFVLAKIEPQTQFARICWVQRSMVDVASLSSPTHSDEWGLSIP